MPKQKSHKLSAKVFNVRPGGTVTMGRQGSRHNTGKKNAEFNRKNRKGNIVSKADRNRLKNILK